MKKILSMALAACLVLTVPVLADGRGVPGAELTEGSRFYSASSGYVYGTWTYTTAAGLRNFQKVREYAPGTYQDVPAGAWYEEGVKTLWERGLTAEDTRFSPGSGLTLGEVVSLAVRVHSTYFGWSVPEGMSDLQYALNTGIVTAGQYDNYSDPASRRSFAFIMAKALPPEALRGINAIMDGAIPDVPSSDPGAWGVYTLYRAGVLVGSDARGTFCPNDKITRASAAVITARMLDPDQRRISGLLAGESCQVTLSRDSLFLTPGSTAALTASVFPANAVDASLTWTSSEPRTAAVDQFGNVTAVRSGTAIITAATGSGVTASCVVRVISSF